MKIFLCLLACGALLSTAAQVRVSAGAVQRFEKFPSRFVQPRTVDVWLPPGYTAAQKYAVLYMHDGQMLFDSTQTWNRQAWAVDQAVNGLLQAGRLRNVLVVAIWNNGAFRHAEYFPQKALRSLPARRRNELVAQELQNKPQADNYLRFLVKELKPFVDSAFSTLPDRNNTFVAGSSMGGLISLYAVCEYPQVFGGAACLSTHWPGSLRRFNDTIPAAFLSYIKRSLPSSAGHRFYFDYGTATLDSFYKPYQLRVNDVLKRKGYNAQSWTTREFAGEDHSENAWQRRLFIPLLFLLERDDAENPWRRKTTETCRLYFTQADAPEESRLTENLAAGKQTVEAFFAGSFPVPFDVYVHAARASLDSTWRRDWQLPDFRSACWMVASGVAHRLDLLSTRAWKAEACDHDPADRREVQQVITHELVHVYHGQHNGSPGFSDTENIDWLVEGLAVYASGQLDAAKLAAVKKALTENRLPARLAAFWTGTLRYPLSGSVVQFIDESYGRKKLLQLLPFTRMPGVLSLLHTTEEALLVRWKAWLAKQ